MENIRSLSRRSASGAAVLIAFLSTVSAAQEPVKSFDQLNTRLKVGDTVYVTDAQAREIKGRILSLGADALALDGGGTTTFAARDVTTIRERRPDSLKNGSLIGLAVGGSFGIAACFDMENTGNDGAWCAAGVGLLAGLGAAIGAGVDALIPGQRFVVYRAPGQGGEASGRLSITPVVTPRVKGVAVLFAF